MPADQAEILVRNLLMTSSREGPGQVVRITVDRDGGSFLVRLT
jgi:hypothetical protein